MAAASLVISGLALVVAVLSWVVVIIVGRDAGRMSRDGLVGSIASADAGVRGIRATQVEALYRVLEKLAALEDGLRRGGTEYTSVQPQCRDLTNALGAVREFFPRETDAYKDAASPWYLLATAQTATTSVIAQVRADVLRHIEACSEDIGNTRFSQALALLPRQVPHKAGQLYDMMVKGSVQANGE